MPVEIPRARVSIRPSIVVRAFVQDHPTPASVVFLRLCGFATFAVPSEEDAGEPFDDNLREGYPEIGVHFSQMGSHRVQ